MPGINDGTRLRPVALYFTTSILFLLVLLLLFSLGFLRNPLVQQDYYGHSIQVPAPAFHLTDLKGRQWRLQDFQGKYVFLMFGYLNCAETCHSQALVMNALSQQIQDDTVRFVYISMDPVRDTVARLNNYFAADNERLTILRGKTIKQVQSVANKFRAPFSIKWAGNTEFEISHPGYIFFINPNGQLAMVYASAIVDVDRLLHDLVIYKSRAS